MDDNLLASDICSELGEKCFFFHTHSFGDVQNSLDKTRLLQRYVSDVFIRKCWYNRPEVSPISRDTDVGHGLVDGKCDLVKWRFLFLQTTANDAEFAIIDLKIGS